MTTDTSDAAATAPEDRDAHPVHPSVSVVLPAFDEADAIPTVIADLREHVREVEVIVVDDASTDDTARIATDLGCTVVRHSTNLGKGAALRSGFDAATGDVVVFMDADATYPAEAVPDMVDLLTDHDYVRGDRAIDPSNTPWINRVGNSIMERVLQTLHGLDRGDHLSGLYGFRREAFDRLDTEAQGFDIEVEIGIKVKEKALSTATVPIDYRPRIGEKKLNPITDGFRILGRILRLVLVYRPLLLFGVPGAALTVVSLVAAILLASGPIQTGYLGLSIHSFIVSALGILAGFQLMTFGVAGAVYRRRLGFSVSPTVRTLTSARSRTVTGLVGMLLVVVCGVWLLVTIIAWVAAGGPAFTGTRTLVATATGAVFGLQMLSASLFITLLSDRST